MEVKKVEGPTWTWVVIKQGVQRYGDKLRVAIYKVLGFM